MASLDRFLPPYTAADHASIDTRVVSLTHDGINMGAMNGGTAVISYFVNTDLSVRADVYLVPPTAMQGEATRGRVLNSITETLHKDLTRFGGTLRGEKGPLASTELARTGDSKSLAAAIYLLPTEVVTSIYAARTHGDNQGQSLSGPFLGVAASHVRVFLSLPQPGQRPITIGRDGRVPTGLARNLAVLEHEAASNNLRVHNLDTARAGLSAAAVEVLSSNTDPVLKPTPATGLSVANIHCRWTIRPFR